MDIRMAQFIHRTRLRLGHFCLVLGIAVLLLTLSNYKDTILLESIGKIASTTWQNWTLLQNKAQNQSRPKAGAVKQPFRRAHTGVEKTVEEVHHVAFLKTHKTGSSTAQNIFLRFGHSRNLTFVLAHSKDGESAYQNVISFKNSVTERNIVSPPPGKSFDILCCHVIYNRTSFLNILPKDTIFIGIVRDPFSRFQSAIRMWHPKYVMNASKDRPITAFAKNPLMYEPTNPTRSWTNNRMALEFGFPNELFPNKDKISRRLKNETKVTDYLALVDQAFDFIIINERFSESLVYMKRLLGWSMKDILYTDHMKRKGKPKSNEIVTDEDKAHLSHFLYLDIALYELAFRRFEKQIDYLGAEFQKEVACFKDLNTKVNKFCQTKHTKQLHLYFNKTSWHDCFSVTKSDCALLLMQEIPFIKLIRLRQYGTSLN